jgi:hypothetical protein
MGPIQPAAQASAGFGAAGFGCAAAFTHAPWCRARRWGAPQGLGIGVGAQQPAHSAQVEKRVGRDAQIRSNALWRAEHEADFDGVELSSEPLPATCARPGALLPSNLAIRERRITPSLSIMPQTSQRSVPLDGRAFRRGRITRALSNLPPSIVNIFICCGLPGCPHTCVDYEPPQQGQDAQMLLAIASNCSSSARAI